jgi:hypothetical protein
MEKEGFKNPASEAQGNLSKAINILSNSKKRREAIAFEKNRLNYILAEYELARSRGDEEGKRRMRDLEIAMKAVKESLEKLSKPISFQKGEAQD